MVVGNTVLSHPFGGIISSTEENKVCTFRDKTIGAAKCIAHCPIVDRLLAVNGIMARIPLAHVFWAALRKSAPDDSLINLH